MGWALVRVRYKEESALFLGTKAEVTSIAKRMKQNFLKDGFEVSGDISASGYRITADGDKYIGSLVIREEKW